MAQSSYTWEPGPAYEGGIGVVKTADMKGWKVEIVRREEGLFDLHIDGFRCNWNSLPTLRDAEEIGAFVNSKLREKA